MALQACNGGKRFKFVVYTLDTSQTVMVQSFVLRQDVSKLPE